MLPKEYPTGNVSPYLSKNMIYNNPFCSDLAYHTQIQLAALNHNMHRERAIAGGERAQHQRVFRKRTKRWDVVPKKEEKQYLYIPELFAKFCAYRYDLDQSLRAHHTGERVYSKTPIPPPPTEEIVCAKRSHFSSPETIIH